jgi:hypothetical protein
MGFSLPLGVEGLLGLAQPDYTGGDPRQQFATWSQPDPALLLNAYQPPPPTAQESMRADIEQLRSLPDRTDWLWLGWLVVMAGGLILKAVL